MGQKVNPHGMRVGVIKDWDSRWYASNEKVGDLLVEDHKIRVYLKKLLYAAGVSKIEIERSNEVVTIYLHVARPGVVIGKGGETINGLVEKYDVKIDINDEGLVSIYGTDAANTEACKHEIEILTKDVEVGEIYEGKVTRILSTAKGSVGAFVEILPGKEGLLHISRMAKERVAKVEDVMNVGDTVKVKVFEIDSQNRINLTRKDILE